MEIPGLRLFVDRFETGKLRLLSDAAAFDTHEEDGAMLPGATTRRGTDGLPDSPLEGTGFEIPVPGRNRMKLSMRRVEKRARTLQHRFHPQPAPDVGEPGAECFRGRSEEHTSELQSRRD